MLEKEIFSQNSFLDMLRQKASIVSIYLVNGIKLQGQIVDYDDKVVFLHSSATQMIFKHAISTILVGVSQQ